MSRELVEIMREDEKRLADDPDFSGPLCVLSELEDAADLIERQDILIKEMAATLKNMALSLSNEDTEE